MADDDVTKYRRYRKSQSSNPLLQKPELGRAKKSCYDLPNQGFTYGRPNPPPEGAAQVIQTWSRHVPNPQAAPGRDFVALNKHSVKTGAVTAKATQEFRNNHDIRLKTGANLGDNKKDHKILPSDADPGFTYGKETRPSTGVKNVINYKAQREWVRDQEGLFESERQHQADMMKTKEQKTREAIEARMNNQSYRGGGALESHRSEAVSTGEQKKLFKLSRFEKVGPRVNFPKDHLKDTRKVRDERLEA